MSGDDTYEFLYGRQIARHAYLAEIAKQVEDIVATDVSQMSRFREMVQSFLEESTAFLEPYLNGESPPVEPPLLLRYVLPPEYQKNLEKPSTKEELLPGHYTVLMLIHDHVYPPSATVPVNDGVWPSEEEWAKVFADYVIKRLSGVVIDAALDSVKRDVGYVEIKSEVDEFESQIIQALGKDTLLGKEIAACLNRKYDGTLKTALKRLIDKNILYHPNGKGYRLKTEYYSLLKVTDKSD